MFLWPSLEYPPLCCGQSRGLLGRRSGRRRKEGGKAESAALWVPVDTVPQLPRGRAQGNPPQPTQIPACSMPGAAKTQESSISGTHLGHRLCTLTLLLLPTPARCRQSRLLPSSISKHFFFFRKKALKSNGSCGGILPKCQHNLCYITGKCDNLNAWLLNVSGTEV